VVTLECIDLTKTFGGIHAVDEVDLTFEAGKITALIGPNGAGKTTLFHLINGYLKPDAGKILYREKEIQGLPPWKIGQLGIGRLFQDVRVFSNLTVWDNLLTAYKYKLGENPLWNVFLPNKILWETRMAEKQARKWLDFVELSDYQNHLAEELSYGQQKLLAIARLLVNDAGVLLLDEPTAGVNPEMIKNLVALIQRLAREENKTVIVIEHNLNLVLDIADWVFFMDEGKITAFGKPYEVLSDVSVREAYLGL